MTEQIPDQLENRMSEFDCSEFLFQRVFTATSFAWEDFDHQPIQLSLQHNKPDDLPQWTYLWKQYINRYVLNEDGTLDHIGYSYLLENNRWKDHDGYEKLNGDFYLDLRKPAEMGRRIFCVPFHKGKIVTDRDLWKTVQVPWFDEDSS